MNLSDKILYEDENVLVINKPSGLMVHSDGRTKEKTLVDWLIEKYPEIKNVGEPWQGQPTTNNQQPTTIYRPGIVHRLDKETSGALLIAKNQETYEFLKKQFQERKVKKVYRAIVWGELKKEHGMIDIPIGRSKKDFRKFVIARGARGKTREAITEYSVLRRFTINDLRLTPQQNQSSSAKGQLLHFTYLEIYPKTGRTHQIRVHMKYLNHPIVCDILYDPKHPCPHTFHTEACHALPEGNISMKGVGACPTISRLALHSFSLEFTLPSGELRKVEAPLPGDFEKVLKSLEKQGSNL